MRNVNYTVCKMKNVTIRLSWQYRNIIIHVFMEGGEKRICKNCGSYLLTGVKLLIILRYA